MFSVDVLAICSSAAAWPRDLSSAKASLLAATSTWQLAAVHGSSSTLHQLAS